MTDYECPDCGGGFPAADADGACPWCGEPMAGETAPRYPITPEATTGGARTSQGPLFHPRDTITGDKPRREPINDKNGVSDDE